MAKDLDWKSETAKTIFGVALTLILTAIWAAFSDRLRGRLLAYDHTVIFAFTALIIAVAIWDFIRFRASAHLKSITAIYAIVVVAFLLSTSFADEGGIKQNAPVWFTLALFGLLKVSNLTSMYAITADDQRHRDRVGFATTGIVVCTSDRQNPEFILVLNRNLRDGKGLWVPPGGHFAPHYDDPKEALLLKVRKEIGMICTVVEDLRYPARELAELHTDLAHWLNPPLFLLDEDLMGACSRGHSSHFDFIYLLITDGAKVEAAPKYPQELQLRVRVQDCTAGVKEAEGAILSSLETWNMTTRGTRPGVSDSVTRDVAWRLHLASEIYSRSRRTTAGQS